MHLFLILLFLAVFQTASAQEPAYKIGFVNTARVLKEAPQARRVEERLKAEFEPREAQLKQKRQEILALEDELKSVHRNLLSDDFLMSPRKVLSLRVKVR